MSRDQRVRQLEEAGAVGGEVEELLAYNENRFDLDALADRFVLPLPDEPFVGCWQGWAEEARASVEGACTFDVLRNHIPQLRFPIREGISQSEDYRSATLRGVDPSALDEATGLEVDNPGTLELEIYRSIAGRIPVLKLYGRQQFTTLVRALTRRNEPSPVPEAMGAQMVSGWNNWERIREHQRVWQETPEEEREHGSWGEAFAELRQRKELYQDRFILLSDGPYSAIPATDLGLTEEEWRAKSLLIRREHECAHYFTRRFFGSMRNHLLDELMADYAGLVAAEGRFRADWFLRFMGLEEPGQVRPGGRIELYRGEPPLSDGAFRALQELIRGAAETLERFDREAVEVRRGPARRAACLAALAAWRIDELASRSGLERLSLSVEEVEQRMVKS